MTLPVAYMFLLFFPHCFTTTFVQAELAVHKKKIEEVENWIRAHTDLTASKVSNVLENE